MVLKVSFNIKTSVILWFYVVLISLFQVRYFSPWRPKKLCCTLGYHNRNEKYALNIKIRKPASKLTATRSFGGIPETPAILLQTSLHWILAETLSWPNLYIQNFGEKKFWCLMLVLHLCYFPIHYCNGPIEGNGQYHSKTQEYNPKSCGA